VADRSVSVPMTLSDLWPDPDFKVTAFFEVKYLENGAFYGQSYYRTPLGNHRGLHSLSNGTMFGDLDWPLNASHGFVSISW